MRLKRKAKNLNTDDLVEVLTMRAAAQKGKKLKPQRRVQKRRRLHRRWREALLRLSRRSRQVVCLTTCFVFSTLPVSSYVNEVCARLSEDTTSSFESQFSNFNAKPTRAHTHSLRATLQGGIYSVSLARRRFRTSSHMKSTY